MEEISSVVIRVYSEPLSNKRIDSESITTLLLFSSSIDAISL